MKVPSTGGQPCHGNPGVERIGELVNVFCLSDLFILPCVSRVAFFHLLNSSFCLPSAITVRSVSVLLEGSRPVPRMSSSMMPSTKLKPPMLLNKEMKFMSKGHGHGHGRGHGGSSPALLRCLCLISISNGEGWRSPSGKLGGRSGHFASSCFFSARLSFASVDYCHSS